MATRIDCEVIVIGGGMVCATITSALARSWMEVSLIDRAPPPPAFDAEHYGLRVSALNRASEYLLDNLGIWSELLARRVSPFRRMEVWDALSDGYICFDSADIGEPHLGHIVENDLLTRVLHSHLAHITTVTLRYHSEPVRFHVHAGIAALELADGELIRGGMLVGADGARSWVRQAAGIRERAASYAQCAIVAEVRSEQPHRQTARQRFLGTGPLAFLPLANGNCSIVWSCDEPLAEELPGLDPAVFAQRLGEAFGWRLGAVAPAGPVRAFPLARAHAESYVADRCVLVGDAAHTVHPLAGQGVNLGLADAAALAQVVAEARGTGRDPGSPRVLRSYERWRKGENLLMLGALDGMQKLFARREPWLCWLRGAGLRITDHNPLLKRQLASRAMGLSGDLPTLARPASRPAA
jgi:2-octaprenylphenol hydroxylase